MTSNNILEEFPKKKWKDFLPEKERFPQQEIRFYAPWEVGYMRKELRHMAAEAIWKM